MSEAYYSRHLISTHIYIIILVHYIVPPVAMIGYNAKIGALSDSFPQIISLSRYIEH